MWHLTQLHGESTYELLPNVKCTIGRKGADLLLTNDITVSRNHAYVIVEYVEENPSAPFVASVVDIGSMSGTFIQTSPGEWKKLSKDTPHFLKSGDSIRFGHETHIWQIHCKTIVTTTSNMSGQPIKDELEICIKSLGGEMTKRWGQECTHLTMENLTLTVKAVCALASGRPIVTPHYWKSYLKNVANKKQPPNYKAFIPPVMEQSLNTADISFGIVETRKNMFAGKQFVFATKSRLKELQPMINAAGGTAVDLQSSGLAIEELSRPHIIVVHFICNPSQEPESLAMYNKALCHLAENGLRAIPESEIGLAVLKSSMKKHCNPAYNLENTLIGNNEASMSTLSRTTVLDLTSQVLAYDTQEIRDKAQSTQVHQSRNIIIPESGTTAPLSKIIEEVTLDPFVKQPSVGQPSSNVPQIKHHDSSNDLCDSKVNKKRMRDPEKVGTLNRTLRVDSSSRKASTSKNIVPDQEDDCFEFPIRKKSKSSEQNSDLYDTSFDFPESTKSKPSKNKTEMVLSKSSTSSSDNQKILDDSEDMFADFDMDIDVSCSEKPSLIAAVPLHTTESHQSDASSKRKRSADSEQAMFMQPVKRPSAPSFDDPSIGYRRRSVGASVSLQGFMIASDIKKEVGDLEDLADAVVDMVLIEPVALIVRRSVTPIAQVGITLNETRANVKNFKKFRKVQHPNQSILPRIIGGRDLAVHFEKQLDTYVNERMSDDEDEGSGEDNADCWSFPTNGVGHSKKAAQRVARK